MTFFFKSFGFKNPGCETPEIKPEKCDPRDSKRSDRSHDKWGGRDGSKDDCSPSDGRKKLWDFSKSKGGDDCGDRWSKRRDRDDCKPDPVDCKPERPEKPQLPEEPCVVVMPPKPEPPVVVCPEPPVVVDPEPPVVEPPLPPVCEEPEPPVAEPPVIEPPLPPVVDPKPPVIEPEPPVVVDPEPPVIEPPLPPVVDPKPPVIDPEPPVVVDPEPPVVEPPLPPVVEEPCPVSPQVAAALETLQAAKQDGAIVGTEEGDDLRGTAEADVIFGLGGDDVIKAKAGDDVVLAGDGNDRVVAGDGDDIVSGGAGDDTIRTGAGDDVIFGDAGDDRIVIDGAGVKVITGGEGVDTVKLPGFETDYDRAEAANGSVVLTGKAGTGGNGVLAYVGCDVERTAFDMPMPPVPELPEEPPVIVDPKPPAVEPEPPVIVNPKPPVVDPKPPVVEPEPPVVVDPEPCDPIPVDDGACIWGDPHFVGAEGGKYDVQGTPGAVYNILSDAGVQVNAEFVSWGDKGATVMGRVGVSLGSDQIEVSPKGGLSINGDAIAEDGSYLDGKVVKTGQSIVVTDEEYTFAFKAANHIDIDFASANVVADGVKPHGLWGQTADGDGAARNGDRGAGAQGGGAIEGADGAISEAGDKQSVALYEVAGLFDTSFTAFNRFA